MPMYKMMLGWPIVLADLVYWDQTYARSLNDVPPPTHTLSLTHTIRHPPRLPPFELRSQCSLKRAVPPLRSVRARACAEADAASMRRRSRRRLQGGRKWQRAAQALSGAETRARRRDALSTRLHEARFIYHGKRYVTCC